MNFAAERFLRGDDWRLSIHDVLERLGRAAGVSRVVVFESEPRADGDVLLSRRFEWRAEGIEARPDEPLQNISMRATGFERWIGVLGRGDVIASHVRDLPATEQPVLAAQGLRSVLAVPVFVGAEWWGFFGFDACSEERSWGAAETEALSAAARMLGEAIRHERAVSALKASEQRYRSLAESAQDAIFIIGRDLRVQYLNECAARALGRSAPEIVGKPLGKLFPAPVAEHYGDQITRVLNTREPVYAEGPSAYLSGDVRLETRLVALVNDAGEATAVLGIARDVTDRWRAERARRAGEERFHAVTESATDAIIVADASGHIVLWNRGAARLFQYERDEIIGQPVSRLIPEPYRTRHTAGVERLQATGETHAAGKILEGLGLKKDGTKVPIEFSLAFWQEAEGRCVGAVVRDISERKEAEVLRRHREAELREAQRIAQMGSWEWDIAADTLTWSDELYRIRRVDPHLPVQRFADLERFFTPESWTRLRAAVDHARSTGSPYELDLEQVRGDGTKFWTTARGEATRDSRGRIVGLRGTLLDITDRKLAEDALRESEARLRQAQKMEAVGQLAGGVAHDFNNLLTAICGYADLVMEGLEDGDPMKADVGEIKKAGDRAAALTRQLLAFGRKQVFRPLVLDLSDVLRDVEAMLRRVIGEDIALSTASAPDLAPVLADPGQIEQVLLNLAVNARDAMPDGGHLTIEAVNSGIPEHMVCNWLNTRAGRCVMLVVRDTGCGMPPDVQAHIFEPFFTTKGPGRGTGLGLSTVYGIVKQSGGSIDVESVVGQGTTFRICIPIADGPRETAGRTRSKPERVGGSETVLLVEDEASVRALILRTLQGAGYAVVEAANAAEALAVAARHAGPIDLLITDLVMPGVNGRGLATEIRARRPAIKALLISGYDVKGRSGEDIEPRGAPLPFLQKPFPPIALLDAVRRALDTTTPTRTASA